MPDGYHLSLSLGRALWDDLLRAALPVALQEGGFDLTRDARRGLRQLQVRERVAGLLEDRRPPAALARVGDRVRSAWRRGRPVVARRVDQVLRVEGTWRVALDDAGTKFAYGQQRVGADAWLKATVEGRVLLLAENIEIPFVFHKRVGASVTLGDIRYDRSHRAIVGALQDLGVHAGEHVLLQLLSRVAERVLEQRLAHMEPVPILRRDQVEEMVGPMGGAFKLKMGVEDLELVVDDEDLTLRVRFGFTQPQLTEDASY